MVGEEAGKFRLVSCPAGFQRQTASHDTQKCHACLESQYIIDPDAHACEKCPPGLICRGDASVEYVVPGSTWAAEQGVYRLQTCPAGYYKISVEGEWDRQMCQPCGEGTECLLEVCDTCSVCSAGKYKDIAGTHACRECPQNTYNPDTNSKAFASCRSCPSGSDTGGLGARLSSDSCRCSTSFYLAHIATIGATVECVKCPKGLECADGSCSIRSSLDVPSCNAASGSRIHGTWSFVDGQAHLLGCPTGFRLVNQTGSVTQHCQECGDGEFMLDSKVTNVSLRALKCSHMILFQRVL